MFRLTNPRRIGALVLSVVLLAAFGLALYRYFFPVPARVKLPAELPIAPSDSVLVIAPHSDDETLGAGGLIERAVAEGARVHVVLMTNGDGFTLAAGEEYRKLRPAPEDYMRLAYQRQKESLAALAVLGVPARDVTFLGYPDRGLAPMWSTYWSPEHRFFSRFTQTDHSPYINSLTPGAPYSGQAVVEDLERVLVDDKPTILVFPHPNDMHPDHWATNAFTGYTLQELKDEGYPFAAQVRQYLYLVHRGDWPAPKGLHLATELVPPGPLLRTDTSWFRFELDPKGTWAKYQAILKYDSQIRLMRRYLESFARKNDLFGTLPPKEIVQISPGSLQVGGTADQWQALAPLVSDPTADTVTRELEGSTDLRTLKAATDGTTLFLRLEARRPVSPRVLYTIRFRPMHEEPLPPAVTSGPGNTVPLRTSRGSDMELRLRVGSPPVFTGVPANRSADVATAVSGGALEVAVPLADLDYPRDLFISAESYLLVTVDRLAWTLAPLPASAWRAPQPSLPTKGGRP
ncbi:MAG: PIG-L family deacetylase [Firmicutes bacterium]|nr:PIG-L family deacetylase [Bacillota bacterium]